jgi:hypothetical protein
MAIGQDLRGDPSLVLRFCERGTQTRDGGTQKGSSRARHGPCRVPVVLRLVAAAADGSSDQLTSSRIAMDGLGRFFSLHPSPASYHLLNH